MLYGEQTKSLADVLTAQQARDIKTPFEDKMFIDGSTIHSSGYLKYHDKRIAMTVEKLREIGAGNVVEVGSHPWAMTVRLIDDPKFEICATVSAEELTTWPDDIGVQTRIYQIKTAQGNDASFTNYSANIERTLFDLRETPDTVVACEIVEHLIRSPHVMFLNFNRWLPTTGKLLVTTPNGAQFANPFRRKSSTSAYRYHTYERHTYLYTLDDLTDLIRLCGFKVLESGYWDVYERHGLSSIYGLLSRLPSRYCRDKFMKTIFIVAEKERDVGELERPPRVYDSRGNWEFIRNPG